MITTLDDWARKYLVGPAALKALRDLLASNDHAPEVSEVGDPGSEARVSSIVRLEAAQADVWLTRNNKGAGSILNPKTGVVGQFMRFGLANESVQQSKIIRSADLIGFRRRVIVTADVGNVIAQFASREVKREGWKPKPNDKHEMGQCVWRDFINSNGGDAAIVSGPGSFNYK